MRVHEALAAALEQQSGRYVSAVHEAGAVMMAHGYACRSGRPGVATVTLGPGLSNTVRAVVEAVRSGTPLVLICGDTVPGNTTNVQSLGRRSPSLRPARPIYR